jgi:flagellar motor switch protein FliN/FliY
LRQCDANFGFAALANEDAPVPTLDKISLDIAVVLGSTTMPIHQALRLGRGAIIELDASEDDEVRILAGNLPIAKGNVVVNGNRIAVEVTQMLPRAPDKR